MRRFGSWPFLAVFGLVFFVGFVALRSQSPVLAAEQQAVSMRELANKMGLSPASVLALRAGSLSLDDLAFEQRAREFAKLAAQWGEEVAAVAVSGGNEVARQWASEDGGAAAAFARHRAEPAALPGVTFAQHRALFAMRPSGRAD